MPKRNSDDLVLVWEDIPYEEAQGSLRNVRRAVESDPGEISLLKENATGPGVRQRVNVAGESGASNTRATFSEELALIEAHLPELLRTVLAETTSEEE